MGAGIQVPTALDDILWGQSNLSDLFQTPGHKWDGDRQMSVEVPTLNCDLVIEGPLDFALLDVEGSEPYVLLGMESTISNSPNLKFIAEWSPAYLSQGKKYIENLNKMLSMLTRFGFSFQHINPMGYPEWNLGVSREPSDLVRHPIGDYLWTRR